jgi:hypothetical protein
VGLVLGLILSGEPAVLQAPMFDGLSLDPFSSFDDGRSPAEVGIGRCHIVEALVVSAVVVMLDEGLDLLVEIAGQEVVRKRRRDPTLRE